MIEFTRIITRHGTNYIVQGDVEGILKKWCECVEQNGTGLSVMVEPGLELFPASQMYLKLDAIESIQALTPEAWAWQKQVEEAHHAQQFDTSQAVAAESIKRMADALERSADE